jgi:hypothetical protein
MPIEFWFVLARANACFTSSRGYESKAKEAAIAGKSFTQIQKTNPANAEKLKAFLTTKALDESKVGFLVPLFHTVHPQRRHHYRPGPRNRQNPRDCAGGTVKLCVNMHYKSSKLFIHR